MKRYQKISERTESLKTPPERFVPIEKQSKKAQREYHSRQRNTWGSLNPVTRKPMNSRAYNRSAEKRKSYDGQD